MTSRNALYWATTIVTASFFFVGGAANLSRADGTMQGLAALGYPAYFAVILGTWKMLGGVAILVPRYPRLKEWAYAGIAFDLSAAACSHLAMGHSAATATVPLVVLGIAAASWALRPASRTLGPAAHERVVTSIDTHQFATAK